MNPAKFIREVRKETQKVTWPTRKETVMTSVMVFIMVLIAALFLLFVDQVLSFGISKILNIGA